MAKRIFDDLYQIIEDVKDRHKNMEYVSPQEKQGFIEGLTVAQQLIEQEQAWCYGDDFAYEKLDEVIKSYKEHSTLDEEELHEILEENAVSYNEEDDENV